MDTKKMVKDSFTFMTWNLYLGADVTPLLTASPNQIPKRLPEVLLQLLTTNFHFRVRDIARQVASKKPDLIGLQEAERFELTVPNSPRVTYDYLELLLIELRKLGLNYEVAVKNVNFTLEWPFSQGNVVKFWDRDVILIRKESGLKVLRVRKAHFNTNLKVKIGSHPFEVIRGWSFVELRSNKGIFRVVNTHLEPDSPVIQIAQSNELLKGPANSNLPIIVLGDLNSNADGTDTPTYENFIHSGFKDVWTKHGKGKGFTCCQDPNLLNPESALNRRIDYILYKNGWIPIKADLAGNEQHEKTRTGLWPSDHAGVVASLYLK